jgi:tyrosyl-tRNA synthetase
VARIQRLVGPLLAFDGDNAAVLVNNLDWTAPLSALDFLREVGQHFRVNQMIRKEAVAARLESLEGISFTEFSYQLLQALDFLELYRAYGCTLQTGGQDQWGNLTAGVDLIHRVEGVSVHAWTTPLLTDAAGEKFGKSAGNAVWLSADMTSPYAFYQYWLNVEDASVAMLLRVFTTLDRDELAGLERAVTEQPHRRLAQKRLAEEVTALVHGPEAMEAARSASEAIFGTGDLASLDRATLEDATQELPGADVPVGASLVDALVATGLVSSRNAARRVIGEGGVSLNNSRVSDAEATLSDGDFLQGRVALLRRGRKAQAAARRVG